MRAAIGDAHAALLANHGTIALGPTLAAAATFTQILEFLATLYYRARLLGDPVILPREEILRVRDKLIKRAHTTPRRSRKSKVTPSVRRRRKSGHPSDARPPRT